MWFKSLIGMVLLTLFFSSGALTILDYRLTGLDPSSFSVPAFSH